MVISPSLLRSRCCHQFGLLGMGEARAERIVESRQDDRPFPRLPRAYCNFSHHLLAVVGVLTQY
jgi:hypothetical protein